MLNIFRTSERGSEMRKHDYLRYRRLLILTKELLIIFLMAMTVIKIMKAI